MMFQSSHNVPTKNPPIELVRLYNGMLFASQYHANLVKTFVAIRKERGGKITFAIIAGAKPRCLISIASPRLL